MNSKYYNFCQTIIHKYWVFWNMFKFGCKIIARGFSHDMSKFSRYESTEYSKVIKRLKHVTYGSPEYKKMLAELKPAIDHHTSINSHHPEHYKNGIADMSMLDKIEMLCDWAVAVRRHNDGDIYRSIEINQKRFGYSDIEKDIFLSIIRELEK